MGNIFMVLLWMLVVFQWEQGQKFQGTGLGTTVYLIPQDINNKLLIEAILKYFGVGYLSVIDSRKDEKNLQSYR